MKSEVPRRVMISDIARKDCPCYGCGNRHSGCHCDCKKYADWRTEALIEKRKHNIAIIKERMANGYEIEARIKNSKKTKQHYV